MKKEGDNSFGTASFSIGLVALVLSLSNQLSAIFLGIIAIILANKQHNVSNNSWCKWGKNLGISAIVVSVVLIIVAVIFLAKNPDLLNQLSQIQG
jgi:hypothetical protein